MKNKLFFLALFVIISIVFLSFCKMENKNNNPVKFKIINPNEANKLISDKKNVFVSRIDFNEASVLQLKNNELLVTPLIPFFNSLIIYNSDFLDSCIKVEQFPSIDTSEASLFTKQELKTFNNIKSLLLNDINVIVNDTTDIGKVENQMKLSLSKNDFKKFRKSFVVFLGEIIISKNRNYFQWAYIKNIGGLNPGYQLVILDTQNNKYYPVEDLIMKFEKEYKSFKDEASLVGNMKMMFDFPKKVKPQYLKVIE